MFYSNRFIGEGHAIGRVRFSTVFFNQLAFDLAFCVCMGHDHCSPEVKVKVLGNLSSCAVNEALNAADRPPVLHSMLAVDRVAVRTELSRILSLS